MDGSPDLKWRGARKMDNKKKGEDTEVTPSEAVTERSNALPSFISYTSTDTKANRSIYSQIKIKIRFSLIRTVCFNVLMCTKRQNELSSRFSKLLFCEFH